MHRRCKRQGRLGLPARARLRARALRRPDAGAVRPGARPPHRRGAPRHACGDGHRDRRRGDRAGRARVRGLRLRGQAVPPYRPAHERGERAEPAPAGDGLPPRARRPRALARGAGGGAQGGDAEHARVRERPAALGRGHRAPALPRDRVPQQGDLAAHRAHGRAERAAGGPARIRARLRGHDPRRGPAARRGQGRGPRRRAAEAGPARSAGAGGHAAPHGDRARGARGLGRRGDPARRLDRAHPPRALRRRRVPGRDRGSRDPRRGHGSRPWPTSSTRSRATGYTGCALPVESAIEIVEDGRGTQFDPRVADTLLGSMDEVAEIRRVHPEPVAV